MKRITRRTLVIGSLLAACGLACAQVQVGPELDAVMQRPVNIRPAEALLRAVNADYLSDEERRVLRVRHGLWEEEDLVAPSDRAAAALDIGLYSDDVFSDESVSAVVRADALLRRGEPERALELIAGDDSARAARVRAQSLEQLGRFAEIDGATRGVRDRLSTLSDSADIADAVIAMMVRARTVGQEQAGGGDYQRLNALLAKARDQISPLDHAPRLAEAALLLEKDNDQEAHEAAAEALKLNPSCSAAYRVLGDQAVGGFDFGRAEMVAEDLDLLVGTLGTGAVSPDAEIIRARARLRQSDADGAEEALSLVLSVYPTHHEALALLAAVSAQRFDFEGVERAIGDFRRVFPGSPMAVYAAGRQCSDARQYARGADYLARAADMQPNWAEPWIALGLLQVQWGDDAEAERALARAFELDPFNLRADNSLRLVRKLTGFESVETEHFIVRYAPGIDALMAKEMPAVLERIYARVAGGAGFAHDPDVKTRIELMPDHRSFAVRIVGMPQVHTIAASTGSLIAMEPPREGAGRTFAVYDWPRVVQHEFAHTVTLSRSKNRLPHWFTEAAAVGVEDGPRDYSRCILLAGALQADLLFDLDEISIRFVRPIKPTDRAQAYAQGHWMYEYIVEREGKGAILRMLDLYAEGKTQRQVFEEVLGETKDEFMAEFVAWARGEVIEWGMAPPAGIPTIEEALSTLRGSGPPDEAVGDGPDPSEDELALLIDRYPEHPDVLEALVSRALKGSPRNLTAETVSLLERYAKARPVDPLPHKRLAAHYLSAGQDAGRAVEHLEYLDAREQYAIEYAVELARIYAAAKDKENAVRKSERAVSLAPFDASVRELAATVALIFGDNDAAYRHIEALTVIEPEREIHKRRLDALSLRMKPPAR